MKNKILKTILCSLVIIVLLTDNLHILAEENNRNAGEVASILEGIVDYKLKETGASSIQQWINNSITKSAGINSEWYVIALSQNGKYDFSKYEEALIKYLSENEVYSAVSRQKYAIALIASGSTNQYIYTTLNDSIGKQGVMSLIFGMHLLNNGYSSSEYSLSSLKNKLLSLQLADGGWAVTGTSSDVDVTAMAVQALAPYYKSDSSSKAAIDKALSLLSGRQLADGDYSSYGVSNSESTAQVLCALSSLGIDCANDNRFIKNGKTVFDGIEKYRLSDGSFCHKSGGGYNETATVQVFYAMVSYMRMENGKTPLYIFDAANPAGLKIPDTITKPIETTVPSEATSREDITEKVSSVSNIKETEVSTIQEKNSDEINSSIADTGEGEGDATTETLSEFKDATDDNVQNMTEAFISADISKGTSDISTSADNDNTDYANNNGSGNYKLWVSIVIVMAAIAVCVFLYYKKQKNSKNFIVIFSVAAIAVIFVWVTNFQTTDSYYENAESVKKNVIGSVTLTIRCDAIVGKNDSEYIPDNGIILKTMSYDIEAGDTVYDVLMEATAKSRIHLETTGSGESVYVQGINHIYEFDYGDLSGWMYHVNGTTPSVGCGEYVLSDGDIIEWLYTCELGYDIE